jgi:hypothetical protein
VRLGAHRNFGTERPISLEGPVFTRARAASPRRSIPCYVGNQTLGSAFGWLRAVGGL